jgi:hypothetical protein
MKKYIKLVNDGKDFGYVTLRDNSSVFYGQGTKAKATAFELEQYKKEKNTFYFKVAGTKESYMDVRAATSRLEIVKPTFSVGASSICAWTLENGELRMIIGEHFTGKCLSRSTDDHESLALFGNILGAHCTVTFEDA